MKIYISISIFLMHTTNICRYQYKILNYINLYWKSIERVTFPQGCSTSLGVYFSCERALLPHSKSTSPLGWLSYQPTKLDQKKNKIHTIVYNYCVRSSENPKLLQCTERNVVWDLEHSWHLVPCHVLPFSFLFRFLVLALVWVLTSAPQTTQLNKKPYPYAKTHCDGPLSSDIFFNHTRSRQPTMRFLPLPSQTWDICVGLGSS